MIHNVFEKYRHKDKLQISPFKAVSKRIKKADVMMADMCFHINVQSKLSVIFTTVKADLITRVYAKNK